MKLFSYSGVLHSRTPCLLTLGKDVRLSRSKHSSLFVRSKVIRDLNKKWQFDPDSVDADPSWDSEEDGEKVEKKIPFLQGRPHFSSDFFSGCCKNAAKAVTLV
jgi:hypothetical protein